MSSVQSISQEDFFTVMTSILEVLLARGACWGKCLNCPQKNAQGVNLTELQQLTLIDSNGQIVTSSLLNGVLAIGLRFGTIRQTPIHTYFLNANMLFENHINYRFKSILTGICEPKIERRIANIM